MSERQVTVVIPAHSSERFDGLAWAVRSVEAQSKRPAEIVVVVDHNEELYERVSREFPAVTVLRNRSTRGVSETRNTGAAHATTPYLAFLDDDADADPDWLARMIEPLAQADVVGTGSASELRWERGRPSWVPDELLWVYGGSYHGMPTVTSTVRNVWAVGMLVRRAEFDSVGGFHSKLSKVGDRSRPEDTELCLRMADTFAGRWVYVPEAAVGHAVVASRTTLRYYLRRCFNEGRGKVAMSRLSPTTHLELERRYLRSTIPHAVVDNMAAALTGRDRSGVARAMAIVLGVGAAGVGGLVQFLHRDPASRRRGPALAPA